MSEGALLQINLVNLKEEIGIQHSRLMPGIYYAFKILSPTSTKLPKSTTRILMKQQPSKLIYVVHLG